MDPHLLVKTAWKRGLDGIAITDHNTIKGALKAKEENTIKDFEVIIGSEIKAADGGEILAYYLSEEIKPGPFADIIDKLRQQDAVIAFAHPFDIVRKHFKASQVRRADIDALEVLNGRISLPFFNWRAKRFAAKKRVAGIAGSDAHFLFEVGRCYTQFEGELRDAITKRKTRAFGSSLYAYAGYASSVMQKVSSFIR